MHFKRTFGVQLKTAVRTDIGGMFVDVFMSSQPRGIFKLFRTVRTLIRITEINNINSLNIRGEKSIALLFSVILIRMCYLMFLESAFGHKALSTLCIKREKYEFIH